MLRGSTALLLFVLACGPAIAQMAVPAPVLHGDLTYDMRTGEAILSNHPSVISGTTLLTADEFRYNQKLHLVRARGHFVLTSGSERILAKSGTYDLATGRFELTDVRAGRPPYYVEAASASGTKTRMILDDATIFYNEPGSLGPTLTAGRLTYEPGRAISGRHGHLGIDSVRLFTLPHFDQSLDQPLLSRVTTRFGYRRNLGAYLDLGLHVPVAPGINVGGDVGEYTARGVLAGPGADYEIQTGDGSIAGTLASGFIRDHGDRKTDLLGRPVPADRGFVDWSHQQTIGPRLTLTGRIAWWSDSEVLRDFRPNQFYAVQQPDSFLQGVYAGDNYYLSAFTRLDPNNFELVQQRLPEIRFDLMPVPIGDGVYERFDASYAVLQQDPLPAGPSLRSDRFDAYYALERPISPTNWLTLTPVAGGRLTYYAKAIDGRGEYTRWLGELGLDARLRASGVFDYHNALWGINGLRHLLTPTLSYRYIPEADRGQPYIPPIDRTVFSTDLQPIDLGAMRNIDQLHAINTLRLGLDNVLQTRDPHYGSRNLLTFDLASDFNFSDTAGGKRWSDVYTRLSLTPAPWMSFDLYQRLDPQDFTLHEFNTGLQVTDHKWWAVQFSNAYLQHQIDQYFLAGEKRLNEVWRIYGRLRYDALVSRWDEVTVGVRQNLRNTWSLRYEMSWYEGRQRENGFGFNVAVDLIRF